MAALLAKLNQLSQQDKTQAFLWAVAFTGVCVLVALGKVQPDMLEKVLFALIGGMAMKRSGGNDEQSGK